jgi:hypothetical protein
MKGLTKYLIKDLVDAIEERDIDTIERILPKGTNIIDFLEKVGSKVHENLDPQQIDSKQLTMGIEIEMEHTDDPIVARKIAIDHLKEDPKYYTKLLSLKLEELNEVGEANLQPYKWEEGADTDDFYTFVNFVTDKGTEYNVGLLPSEITPEGSTSTITALDVEFSTRGNNNNQSVNVVTNKGELYRVMATIVDIIKHYVKHFKAQAITYHPSKKRDEEFGIQRDKLYKAFITKAISGVKFKQEDQSIIAILPGNTLQEQQENPLQDYIDSLNQYMMDRGLNITPIPQVEFINNDQENANKILGKTAHYNPDKNIVALYTLGRHPKDILRSYAHEMIHHAQNLQGRLNDINTTNVNEDANLFNLEQEAYVLGNMIFRSWENKNNSSDALQ